jgi:hypothetical protein
MVFAAVVLLLESTAYTRDLANLSIDLTEIGKTVELEIGRVNPSELKTLKIRIHNKSLSENL